MPLDLFAEDSQPVDGTLDLFADEAAPAAVPGAAPAAAPAPAPAAAPASDETTIKLKQLAEKYLQGQPLSPRQITLVEEFLKRKGIPLGYGQMKDSEQSGSFMSFLEPLLTLGTAAIAEPVAGLAGIAGSVLPGKEGQGADWVEQTRKNLTYLPKTKEGQENLQGVGETLEPVGETFNKVEKALGDFAYDMTGSPALAAAAATTPTALLSLLSLAGLKKMRPGTRLLDNTGNPTPELRKFLDKEGLVFENLDPQVKASIPAVLEPANLPGAKPIKQEVNRVLAQEIQAGGQSDALAGLKVDQFGNVVKDTAGTEALRQGFRPGVVQSIKTATPETKARMREMLTRMRQGKKNERFSVTNRPTDVTGDAVMERVKFIRKKVNEATQQLDEVAKQNLPGKPIDTYTVTDALSNELDRLGVNLTDDLTPIFKGSDIQTDRTAQRAIKDVIDLLKEGDGADALRAHKVKRMLDRMIDYKKSSSTKLTPAGERVIKKVRRALNEAVRDADPEYAQLNDILSDGVGALTELNDSLGPKIDIIDTGADKAIGQEMRKLLSNYAKRNELNNVLDQLDGISAKFGGTFNDDIKSLVMFANALDDKFGAVAKGSLQGTMESAGRRVAETAIFPKTGIIRGAGELGGKAVDKLRGINEFGAFESLENLLK